MGQAKTKRLYAERYLREIIANNVEPISDLESKLKTGIDQMDVENVYTPDTKTLIQSGNRVGQCHHNCFGYQRQFHGHQIITGWLVMSDDYVLHSNIRIVRTGRLIDITPRSGDLGKMSFKPDPSIRMKASVGPITTKISFERNGLPFDISIVRRSNEWSDSLAQHGADAERALANGVHPYDAMPGLKELVLSRQIR